jgi:hypothetical protein
MIAGGTWIQRPPAVGAFQFVVLATLRAAQLTRGCLPKIVSTHKHTVTAQVEVAEGKITQFFAPPAVVAAPAGTRAAALEPARDPLELTPA